MIGVVQISSLAFDTKNPLFEPVRYVVFNTTMKEA
jgi:hypothetical protein